MVTELEMQRALELDGEKLRQLTGEDHGPWDADPVPVLGDCRDCNGEGTHYSGRDWDGHPRGWFCETCRGTGREVIEDAQPVTLSDLEEEEPSP